MTDRDRESLEVGDVELEAVDSGQKAGERDDRGRAFRRAAPEAERPAHHGALREAAEHRPLERNGERVEPGRRRLERRPEGCRVGRRDPAERVPVRASGRKRERPARREPEQTPLGIERVEEREEVALVGAAAVEENERPLRLARRVADERLDQVTFHAARGSGSFVNAGSIRSRRCSKAGGSESRSPRCAGSSSVAKPGPSVASSKRTPFGSRK